LLKVLIWSMCSCLESRSSHLICWMTHNQLIPWAIVHAKWPKMTQNQ
jgi:hypothetical protein